MFGPLAWQQLAVAAMENNEAALLAGLLLLPCRVCGATASMLWTWLEVPAPRPVPLLPKLWALRQLVNWKVAASAGASGPPPSLTPPQAAAGLTALRSSLRSRAMLRGLLGGSTPAARAACWATWTAARAAAADGSGPVGASLRGAWAALAAATLPYAGSGAAAAAMEALAAAVAEPPDAWWVAALQVIGAAGGDEAAAGVWTALAAMGVAVRKRRLPSPRRRA